MGGDFVSKGTATISTRKGAKIKLIVEESALEPGMGRSKNRMEIVIEFTHRQEDRIRELE